VLTERTLCHLDLFAANLMYGSDRGGDDGDATEEPAAGPDIQFIDYEYSADAMVGLALDVKLTLTPPCIFP
jgi:hypothetical protein